MSRYRGVLMQAVLCAVLGLTLLLAAAVARHHRQRGVAELESPMTVGGLTVRTPAGWVVRQGTDGVRFEEPAGRGGTGRRLEVWQARSAAFMSPLEYLVRSGDLRLRDAASLLAVAGRGPAGLRPVLIGGWPGLMFSQSHLFQNEQGIVVPRGQTVACAVLPDGGVVLVRLENAGLAGEAEQRLVRAYAASITIADASARAGGELELDDDMGVRVPAGLFTSASADPFHVSRRLYARTARGWVGVELTPCIASSNDGLELASMLRRRDAAFRPGPVSQVDEGVWACDRANPGVGPARAYLMINPDRRALLVDFRWVAAGGDEVEFVEALWEEIREGVSFAESDLMAERLKAGEAALAAFPEDPAALLEGVQLEQSWQWYHEEQPRISPMARHYVVEANSIAASESTIGWVPPAGEGIDMRNWRLSRTWDSYAITINRGGAAPVLGQNAVVKDGQIQVALTEMGEPIGVGAGAVPPPFVPGGVLPLVLGQLPFEPMILRTESILWPTASASLTPLTLVLEPSHDVPQLSEEGVPMRCWRVRVSGLPESSRWYFEIAGKDDAGNELIGKLHSVRFAGKVRLQRLDPEEPPPDR